MIVLNEIIGSSSDPELSDSLHELEHQKAVEYINLPVTDTSRRRMRAVTDKGTECGIALPRDQKLGNGAVLLLTDEQAIIVRVEEEAWIRFKPIDAEAALELGYNAGNLHWRVRFEGDVLLVAQEGPVENYLNRITPLLKSRRVIEYAPNV